jgi:hypothetical protein
VLLFDERDPPPNVRPRIELRVDAAFDHPLPEHIGF